MRFVVFISGCMISYAIAPDSAIFWARMDTAFLGFVLWACAFMDVVEWIVKVRRG